MRSARLLPAISMCLAVLLMVGVSGSAALGASALSAARASAIPAGFHAQSVSWVSPKQGWMIGSAPCGQATCTTVLGTTDAGATWNKRGILGGPLTLEEPSGATEIRFADDQHGWAFEPALYATSDGGASWQKQAPPGGGHLVLALAADSDAVYAV